MVIKKERFFIWTPPASTRLITSITIDGTEYKTKVLNCKVHRHASKSSGFAEITVLNEAGQYRTTFNVGDILKIFADYDSGTTQIFEGRIKSPSLDSLPYPVINITALDYTGDALKKIVNKVYTTPTDAGQVFVDLITDYLASLGHTATATSKSGYTSGAGVVTDTGYSVTPVWQNKTLFECLIDLVGWTEENYTFYCNFSKEWQFFEKGAIYNEVDAIVDGGNLFPGTFKWVKDQFDSITKVTLIGAQIDGISLTATVGTGDIEVVKQDSNITNWSTLKSKAQSILNTLKTDEYKGECKCSIMPTLQPGDSVYVFNPDYNLQEEEYITEFVHEFGQKGISTFVKFQEKGRIIEELSTVIMDNINQTKNQIISENPFGLKNVIVLSANETDFPKLSVVSITNGVLITSSKGTATSRNITADAIVTKAYIKVLGEDLANVSVAVSFDNGVRYESITRETEYTPITAGTKMKLKISLNTITAKCQTVGLYFT